MTDQPTAANAAANPIASPVSAGYGRYAVVVLMVLYALNFLDRQIMSILAEPIKQDLGLADWQIGVMSGLAFALFYTTLGIPIARLAERANRPYIIAACAVAWSTFTALCGAAQNFGQLVLARIGVGVGEAGCVPASMSLISDYVPKEKRASAIAFYMAGGPLGSLCGMVIGGYVASHWGWRTAFFVVGAPGILAGALAALTLVEPRKRMAAASAAAGIAKPVAHGIREVARILWDKRTYRRLVVAVSIKSFINYGLSAFTGSFYLRNHADELAATAVNLGMKPLAFLGLALGLALGLTGVLGAIAGGWLSDRVSKRDARNQAAIPAIAVLVSTPLYIAALAVDSMWLSLVILLVPATLNALWYGPAYAMVQGLVAPNMRATATAVLLFIISVVGLGLGPVGIGLLSDVLSNGAGLGDAAGVRWSLIAFVSTGMLAGVEFWRARATLQKDTVS